MDVLKENQKMRLYERTDGTIAGTQAEAGKGFRQIEVPTDKAGLIDYLNRNRHVPCDLPHETTERLPAPPLMMVDPAGKQPPVVLTAPSLTLTDAEEFIQNADAPQLARLADNVCWRIKELAALQSQPPASSAGGEVVERFKNLFADAHQADDCQQPLECDPRDIIALETEMRHYEAALQSPSNEARLREARNSWAALIGTNAAGSEDAPRIVAELNAELAALSNEGNG